MCRDIHDTPQSVFEIVCWPVRAFQFQSIASVFQLVGLSFFVFGCLAVLRARAHAHSRCARICFRPFSVLGLWICFQFVCRAFGTRPQCIHTHTHRSPTMCRSIFDAYVQKYIAYDDYAMDTNFVFIMK